MIEQGKSRRWLRSILGERHVTEIVDAVRVLRDEGEKVASTGLVLDVARTSERTIDAVLAVDLDPCGYEIAQDIGIELAVERNLGRESLRFISLAEVGECSRRERSTVGAAVRSPSANTRS